ncbi:hypothetical protein CDAR_454291 [Caerostris darwini]|uniref:Uncharacterized protein n=1 Tax=Caerostris darwini TaxID=1538125 RepID=A0AAV4V7S7_9ARAC|nr:hypothetical protein CDAR_454291 [Caerostris darwini]
MNSPGKQPAALSLQKTRCQVRSKYQRMEIAFGSDICKSKIQFISFECAEDIAIDFMAITTILVTNSRYSVVYKSP